MRDESSATIIDRRQPSDDCVTKQPDRIDIDVALQEWDAAQWSIACREMIVRIIHRNAAAAHSVLSHFMARKLPGFATLDTFAAMVLPHRIANIMESAGYYTLRSIDAASDDELLEIENMGDLTLQIIRRIVASVKAGECFEISCDDVYQELIDPADGYFAALQQRDSISKPSGEKPMNKSGNIKDALATLLGDREQSIEIIDAEIASLEADLSGLRQMRRMLVVKDGEPDKQNRKLTPGLQVIEEAVFAAVTANGQQSLEQLRIELGRDPKMIGKAIVRSTRLVKSGDMVMLA